MIGDAAARFTLDVYLALAPPPASATGSSTSKRSRTTSSHRSPRAGVIASMQPVHLTAHPRGRHRHLESAARPRARRAGVPDARPARRRRGARPGLRLAGGRRRPAARPGRGAPAAAPQTPGYCRPKDQAITAHEALAGYTLVPAFAAGEEAWAGRIHEGMRADFTGLAVDPIDAPAAEFPDNPVWLTVVNGRVVHRRCR